MYQKQINRAFIGLLVCFVISCVALAAPPNSSSKEVRQYCQAMGNVAGDVSYRLTKGQKPIDIQRKYLDEVMAIPDEYIRNAIMSAVNFAIAMNGSYPPETIAKYQYYGCLATV